MSGCQAFYRIGGTIINFDLAIILQDHAAGENDVVAESPLIS